MLNDVNAPLGSGHVSVPGKRERLPQPPPVTASQWMAARTDPQTWKEDIPELHESGRGGRPVVVLLGWAGATRKQLAPFVYFWLDQGCSVLRYTADIWGMSNPDLAKKPMETLYHHIRTHTIPSRGFLVHCCSSLGAHTLGCVLNIDNSFGRGLFEFCRGIIYDSGPGLMPPEQVASEGRFCLSRLSETAGVITSATEHKPLAPVVHILWTPYFLLILLFYAVWYGRQRMRAASDAFEGLTSVVAKETRILFLFSETDDFIPKEEIQGFRDMLRRRGYKVKECILQDTYHFSHMVDCPEATHKALLEFLVRCEHD
eukprot:Sspe_Gene.4224::Locus_1391_Transcript_1_1_Confidence_1.000_Length_2280::g.4224::m.4224